MVGSLVTVGKLKLAKKGTGFVRPLTAHDHRPIDVSYVNVACPFHDPCAVLDCFSRYIVHWEIKEAIKESEFELILQRARRKFPIATHHLR